jgi:predicted RNase H-like nuclease (RuvC/YqgF family)
MANRRKQIQAVQQRAADFAADVEMLKEELEESLENMPESLQYSANGERMQERIDLLDTWLMNLNEMAEEDIG